ncbi:MAG TPA: 4-hydroxy-tetrahydrodipicolinate reductase [Myxococcota bacterium]|nr:4-hydroxy-tetrahydrodipicolinate reductase [Myxococcota bacterium]
MRVAINGAAGRMGMLLVADVMEAEDLVLAGATDAAEGFPSPAPGVLDDAQVVIDFSLPEGTEALLDCLVREMPLVIGTTGLGPSVGEAIEERGTRAPIVLASNFSTGITLLNSLVARAAATLPDFHVEIVEMHHEFKRDAPSGTALTLGRAVADARDEELGRLAVHGRLGETGIRSDEEIGFHALRGGDISGEHTVYLAGPGERLKLAHLATSRQAFASGALRAARWVVGRPPGLYDMRDVLGLR